MLSSVRFVIGEKVGKVDVSFSFDSIFALSCDLAFLLKANLALGINRERFLSSIELTSFKCYMFVNLIFSASSSKAKVVWDGLTCSCICRS